MWATSISRPDTRLFSRAAHQVDLTSALASVWILTLDLFQTTFSPSYSAWTAAKLSQAAEQICHASWFPRGDTAAQSRTVLDRLSRPARVDLINPGEPLWRIVCLKQYPVVYRQALAD